MNLIARREFVPAFGRVPDAAFANADGSATAAGPFAPAQLNAADAAEPGLELNAILPVDGFQLAPTSDDLELAGGRRCREAEPRIGNLGYSEPNFALGSGLRERDREAEVDRVPTAPDDGNRVDVGSRKDRQRRLAVQVRPFQPHVGEWQLEQGFAVAECVDDEARVEPREAIFEAAGIHRRADHKGRFEPLAQRVQSIERAPRHHDDFARRLGPGQDEGHFARCDGFRPRRDRRDRGCEQGERECCGSRAVRNACFGRPACRPNHGDGTQQRRDEWGERGPFPGTRPQPIRRAENDQQDQQQHPDEPIGASRSDPTHGCEKGREYGPEQIQEPYRNDEHRLGGSAGRGEFAERIGERFAEQDRPVAGGGAIAQAQGPRRCHIARERPPTSNRVPFSRQRGLRAVHPAQRSRRRGHPIAHLESNATGARRDRQPQLRAFTDRDQLTAARIEPVTRYAGGPDFRSTRHRDSQHRFRWRPHGSTEHNQSVGLGGDRDQVQSFKAPNSRPSRDRCGCHCRRRASCLGLNLRGSENLQRGAVCRFAWKQRRRFEHNLTRQRSGELNDPVGAVRQCSP